MASEAWFTCLVVLLVVVPVVVVLIEAVAHGYAPNGDRAVVAIRAHDALSSHPPLVGAYSTTSVLTGVDTFSPGPLLYWLLALPVRLPGFWALPTAIALVNGASVAATVLLARRRGGTLFMLVTGASLVVLYSSLPTDLPNDIWAPSAPVLPFALLVIVGWSIACGDAFLLPWAALLASFVVQCHLAYLLPGLLILGVACLGLIATVRPGNDPSGPASRHSALRWALIAAVVAAICWSLPVVDQVLGLAGKGGHGNLAHIVKAVGARGETAGLEAGIHGLVHAIGVPPWWLRTPPLPQDKTFELFSPASTLAVVTTIGWLGALAACLLAGWRRRRVDVMAACGIAAGLCVSVVAFTASFPNSHGLIFSFSYSSWWASPAGMWTWLLIGWSATTLVEGPRRIAAGRAALIATAVASVVAVAFLGFRERGHAVDPLEYRPSGSLISQVRENVPHQGPVLLTLHSFGFGASATYALRLEGLAIGSPDARELGTSYDPADRHFAQTVEVTESDRRPAPGSQVIAEVTFESSPPRTIRVIRGPGPD